MPETSILKGLLMNVAVAAIILVVGLWVAKKLKASLLE